ncbi:MAG: hypothetical protein FWC73_06140 [Defluviitaleaceae bacterium]|nr:hypothetical protein [Defluviitaleaceae bacterium]
MHLPRRCEERSDEAIQQIKPSRLLRFARNDRICIEIFMIFAYQDSPVMVWILNNQLARRNLNSAMRIEMALLKEEMLREKAKKNYSLNGGDKVTNRAALTKMTKPETETINVREKLAAEANIGEGTLLRYKQIKNSGDPDLLAKVQSGELTIGAAYKQLEKKNLSKETFWRLRRVDDGLKFIAKYLPPDDDQPVCQELRRRLRDLYQLQ